MSDEPVYQPTLSVRLQIVLARRPGVTMRDLMDAVDLDPRDIEDVSRVEILLGNLRRLNHAVRDRRPPVALDDRWALTEAGVEYVLVTTPSGEAPLEQAA